MILRRITDAFRKQDWFTVAVETLIVVLGVFLGLQVNNWNAARQDRARAAVYSERLKAELHAELEYAGALLEYNSVTSSAGEATYLGLSGQAAMDDETILINAYRASQYNWYERRRATFDEIVASGSLALISDVGLRETAIGIYNTSMFSIIQSEGQSSRYRAAREAELLCAAFARPDRAAFKVVVLKATALRANRLAISLSPTNRANRFLGILVRHTQDLRERERFGAGEWRKC